MAWLTLVCFRLMSPSGQIRAWKRESTSEGLGIIIARANVSFRLFVASESWIYISQLIYDIVKSFWLKMRLSTFELLASLLQYLEMAESRASAGGPIPSTVIAVLFSLCSGTGSLRWFSTTRGMLRQCLFQQLCKRICWLTGSREKPSDEVPNV